METWTVRSSRRRRLRTARITKSLTRNTVSKQLFKLKVVEAVKATHQFDQSRFLDVKIQVLRADDDEELVEERRLGFPLEASKEDIDAELAKFLATYTSDFEQSAASAKVEEAEKGADETAAALTGSEIK